MGLSRVSSVQVGPAWPPAKGAGERSQDCFQSTHAHLEVIEIEIGFQSSPSAPKDSVTGPDRLS